MDTRKCQVLLKVLECGSMAGAAEVFGTIVQRKDPVARMYSVHTVLESDVPGKDEREVYFTAKFEDGPSVPEKKSSVNIIPIAAGLAVAVTAVAVYVLRKKKKN